MVRGERSERAREQFGRRCGYCGVHENDAAATLTLDHHRPRAHGGEEQTDNLVYACHRCNDHKGSYWHEHDPPHIRLLHPGHEDPAAHLRQEPDGRLVGTTREGEFFVERLHLNRPQLIVYRLNRRAEQDMEAKLASALDRMRTMDQRLDELSKTIDGLADEIDRD